jgi:putative nucleotidyltransferase with HDIG domain
MAVPHRDTAAAILASYALPEGIAVHARGVARVAEGAAAELARAGIPIDAELVAVAALLHDIDKVETRRTGELHGIVAARWLTELGYEELAMPVASHPIGCLIDDERFPRGWPSVLVSIADRHVTDRFVTIDERVDDLLVRYPDDAVLIELARRPAHVLQGELAEVTGLDAATLERRLRTAWEVGA